MNPLDTIAELGGGPIAVALVVLGSAVVVLYRRNNVLQDKLLEMAETRAQESRELLTDTNKITGANTEVMRRAVLLLEDKRGEPRLLEDRR